MTPVLPRNPIDERRLPNRREIPHPIDPDHTGKQGIDGQQVPICVVVQVVQVQRAGVVRGPGHVHRIVLARRRREMGGQIGRVAKRQHLLPTGNRQLTGLRALRHAHGLFEVSRQLRQRRRILGRNEHQFAGLVGRQGQRGPERMQQLRHLRRITKAEWRRGRTGRMGLWSHATRIGWNEASDQTQLNPTAPLPSERFRNAPR